MIIWKFLSASLNTKLTLFRAYCTPIYGFSFGAPCISTLLTSYVLHTTMLFDNCYKNHGGVLRQVLFAFNDVSSLPVIMRKLLFSFWCSLQACDNSIVNAALVSDLYVQSPLLKRWHRVLF